MKRNHSWTVRDGSGQGAADTAPLEPISLADLEAAVRGADARARLIAPRVLRRVIREDASLGGFGVRVPHGKSYVIRREPLLDIADAEELGCSAEEVLPETVILLERPGHEELAAMPAEVALAGAWRLLFHARIHCELARRTAAGRLSEEDIRQRIRHIGFVEFEEIRSVLRQERMLLPPEDDATTYAEFAAVYFELRYFAPGLLSSYFPSLRSCEAVEQVLNQDVDAEELLLAARPAGAPDPREQAARPSRLAEHARGTPASPPAHEVAAPHAAQDKVIHWRRRRHDSQRKYRVWNRRAEKASAEGNLAGAAGYRARAEYWAPREQAAQARAALRNDVHRLAERLQAALAIAEKDLPAWRETLLALAHQTPRGIWTVEARTLYDLQKVCIDHERDIYRVDVIEWLLSWGKRPIQRPLPSQRDVLMAKHLRSAEQRLMAVRISHRQRRQFSELLGSVTRHAEERLRDRFRPHLAETLDEVGLSPRNLPERVAKKKLVEELLDQIVERGHLKLGDLRDALSRGNLKQPDWGGAREAQSRDARVEFVPPHAAIRAGARGEDDEAPLLRADRRLGERLDGVYERGEVYLRGLQRFSSLAFGTPVGRFLTRYLAVPFGGAFLVLAGVDEMANLITNYNPELASLLNVTALGAFFLGLIYVAWFRSGVWRAVKAVGRGLRMVFVDSLRWLVRLPLVQKIWSSRFARLGTRFFLKPLVPTLVLWQVLHPEVSGWETTGLSLAFFLAMNLALNSRFGRTMEEVASDWIVEGWHRFGIRVITGAFWFVMDVFRRLLQVIERFLYAVDEWLRFKTGESRASFLVKAVLGSVWFFVTYVIRFAVNVLLEPQINPIKHFPVVTVSHKLLLPTIPHFAGVLEQATGMEKALALTVVGTIITCIPGVFGFLVWELKENWRLYAANRPKTLRPVMVGSHGETLVRLLRPGFHSGTVPKRFAKLRRAERNVGEEGSKAARKHREALHHVERAVRRWVEREFVALLAESRDWRAEPPRIDAVWLASNRVQIQARLPGEAAAAMWISFDLEAGWMLAGFSAAEGDEGNAEPIAPEAARVLRTALVGLYKTGGVELVRGQIEAAFPEPVPAYGLCNEGLLVWPDDRGDVEVFYDLREQILAVPRILRGLPQRNLPTLHRSQVVFAEKEVTWEQWVAAWEPCCAGPGCEAPDPWERAAAQVE